jgi:ArsR family transcriptional regulator
MTADYVKESKILKALAHPARLRIVEGLLTHECNVDKIVKGLQMPQSTISQHLGLLRERGILQMRKEGVKTCYCVADHRVADIMKIFKKRQLKKECP